MTMAALSDCDIMFEICLLEVGLHSPLLKLDCCKWAEVGGYGRRLTEGPRSLAQYRDGSWNDRPEIVTIVDRRALQIE